MRKFKMDRNVKLMGRLLFLLRLERKRLEVRS
jgi:hypothetical protein